MEVQGFQTSNYDSEGALVVSEPSKAGMSGSNGLDFLTPNICDQTTWYQQATLSEDVTLSEISSTVFRDNANTTHVWINPFKLAGRDYRLLWLDGTFKSLLDFRPEFTANDTPVAWTDIANVNFLTREVTFRTSKSGQTIKFTGFKVLSTSHFQFLLVPPATKIYEVSYVECQFSPDIGFEQLKQFLRFEVLIGAFSQTPFTDLDFDTRFWDETCFMANGGSQGLAFRQSFTDPYAYESVGNRGVGSIPDWGGKGHTSLVFPFNYGQSVNLKSSALMGLRLHVIDSVDALGTDSSGALQGTFATTTFYGYLKDM